MRATEATSGAAVAPAMAVIATVSRSCTTTSLPSVTRLAAMCPPMFPSPITPVAIDPPRVRKCPGRRPRGPAGRERIVKPDSSVRDPGGQEFMGLRDHVICDSDLHVMEPPDLWERYIDPAYAHAAPARAVRDHARHAGAGEEPRDAADGLDPAAAGRGSQDRLEGRARDRLRGVRGPGLGPPVTDRRHGRGGARPGRAVPVPRAVRARPRLVRADRRRRPGARVRHCDRPRLQRLAQGLLRPRPRPHVRVGHGGGARRRRRGRRGAALRGGARLQVDLPSAGRGEPPSLAPPRLRPAVGRDSSASACRCHSTGGARPT